MKNCPAGGGKSRKTVGKTEHIQRTGFLEKHTNLKGKNPKYEIQEEIL